MIVPVVRPGERREWSVAGQVLTLQVVLVLVLVATAVTLALVDARADTRDDAADRALAVAESLADSPALSAAVAGPDPAPALQPWASEVEEDTDVDFVVVMDTDRTRFTHPDPEQVGRPFVGDIEPALAGRPFTQEYVGTLGPSVRAVVPVFAAGGAGPVVALVSVGVSIDRISDAVRAALVRVTVAAAVVLLVGVAGAALVARRLRRQTHGLGEREMTRMYEYYAAVLGAVREGLLLVDVAGRVTLVNDEARRLLDLPADGVVGTPLRDLGLPPGLVAAVAEGRASSDDLYVTGDKVLVVSSSPASWADAAVGAVVTLRDRTDLQAVTGELDVVRALGDSLRAQNHEAANRLHTVVSLVEMGRVEEAVDFATEELQVAQLLTDRVVAATGDPVLAALLLGKTAEAAERGIDLRIEGDVPTDVLVPHRDIVTVVGNLVDNALDAVATSGVRTVRVTFSPGPGRLRVLVEDAGPGLDPADAARAFERGWTTKATADGTGGRGIGLALVAQVARRHGGDVVVGSSDLGGAAFTVDLRADARADAREVTP
ncbi:ATP-binding protein [Nocardioides sp. CPCC 205120]|uniref:sensor histidine kinase n=1 Tax=Nocardioides sp. CPCC 205120 TaxID=3406462 RepID=UPI003B50A7EA